MALKSTIFKADLQIADMDRNYYQGHSLTLARHPSETDERMMVRLLAFALFADERLEFGRGLSADDEPALWRKDLTGAIELWIEVGLPDERELRKACGRAERVVVLCYGGRGAELWWDRTARSWRACATWPCSPCGRGHAGLAAWPAAAWPAVHDPGRPALADRRQKHGTRRAADSAGGPLAFSHG